VSCVTLFLLFLRRVLRPLTNCNIILEIARNQSCSPTKACSSGRRLRIPPPLPLRIFFKLGVPRRYYTVLWPVTDENMSLSCVLLRRQQAFFVLSSSNELFPHFPTISVFQKEGLTEKERLVPDPCSACFKRAFRFLYQPPLLGTFIAPDRSFPMRPMMPWPFSKSVLRTFLRPSELSFFSFFFAIHLSRLAD